MIPKKKYEEFIETVNQLIENGDSLDDLSSLEREAQKLEYVSYSEFKMALGIIATLRGDAEDVDKQFNAALKATGYDTQVLSNYASALMNIQKSSKALEVMRQAVEAEPHDISVLKDALDVAIGAYNLEESLKLFNALESLQAVDDTLRSEYEYKSAILQRLYLISGADWKDFSERETFLSSVIRKDAPKLLRRVTEFYSEDAIILNFYLNADIETSLGIENTLIEKVASLPYSPVDKVLIFTCEPHERYAS